MTTSLDRDRALWESHARHDPLWAVLSAPERAGRRWDLQSFFETGSREIATLFYRLHQLRCEPVRRSALDFGCGVGRLTQALALRFEHVTGVDISPTMLALARRLDVSDGRIAFVENDKADLALLGSSTFDFIYSDIVLQHLEPDDSRAYLLEFCRLLAPGGVLVFQLPSHRRSASELSAPAALMSSEAYRHDLLFVEGLRDSLMPGERLVVTLGVRNTSPCDWHQFETGPLRLGNHWLSANGHEMLIQDDGRTALPSSMKAAEECRLSLTVTAPSEEGHFVLEVDLVHEGVTWFGDRGASTLRQAIAVIDGQTKAAPRAGDPAGTAQPPDTPSMRLTDEEFNMALGRPLDISPEFPMHGIERDDVVGMLTSRGLRLVDCEVDERCGREWVGYRYVFSGA